MLKKFSLQVRLAVPIILTGIAVFGVMTYFISTHTWNDAKSAAIDKTLFTAKASANDMKAELQVSLDVARNLGQQLLSLKEQSITSRELISQLIKDTLKANKYLIGVWTGWESQAWDGKDVEYRSTKNHDASEDLFLMPTGMETM